MKKYIILAALCASTLAVRSQPWDINGNGGIVPGTNYIGTTNIAPLDFHTANIFRARINERVTYSTLGGFPSIPADGFTLITPNLSFFNLAKGPFSRLHLAEGEGLNALDGGYRPWQRNGITFTGNSDQAYIGQKYDEDDNTDFVIQWSDNPDGSRWGTDRMGQAVQLIL